MEKRQLLPFGAYIMVWFGLLVLTGVTVTAAGLQFGQWSALAAICIATAKSCLVLFYFMHLKNEGAVLKLMLMLALLVLAVILVLTFVDVSFR